MKKINLDKSIVDLNQKELKDENGNTLTLAKTLGNFFAGANTEEPGKYIAWAVSLMTEGVIKVDDTDKNKILDLIKTHKGMTNILKHQLITEISK